MGCQGSTAVGSMNKVGDKHEAVSLGIVRLDYDYPAAPGDIDSPESYAYDVFFRVVPGYTFSVCQHHTMNDDVKKEFNEAILWLPNVKKVKGITGDCGFMMWAQAMARQSTHIPVFMSALCQLPAVTCAFAHNEKIIIMTANSKTLEPMHGLIKDECGVEIHEDRYKIYGGEDIPGFEAVALGEKVDTAKVEPGMVAMCQKALKENPDARGFLFECTELPPYSDAVRHATGLPVYDAITGCDFFMNGF